MDCIPILTIENVAQIDAILQDYLQKSESDLAVIIDKGGNVISQCGEHVVVDVTNHAALDVTIIAALAAGSFAATKELARRIGEVEFNALYHQGNGSHIFMNSVDDDTIMITVFGKVTTVGLVRFYANTACQSLALLLTDLREKPSLASFRFDAADIVSSAMVETDGVNL